MLGFGSLWWVVILAAVAVWVASAIVWMVLPHHRSDFGKLPDEDAAMQGIGKDTPVAQYRVPHCSSMEAMQDEGFQAKQAEGPVALITVYPSGPPNMGKMLGLWFCYCVLASFVIAYLARMWVPAGTEWYPVFRFTGAAAFAVHALPALPDSIWMGKPWSTALKSMADGVFYALVTGAVFASFWPGAAA